MARVGHGTDRRKILKMPLTQFLVPALCHLTVNTAVITSLRYSTVKAALFLHKVLSEKIARLSKRCYDSMIIRRATCHLT